MANNMASKMVRLITASSLPAAGLLFTTVYAAEKVHPSELDIYDKPTLVHEVIMEDPPNEFEKKVSGGRKQAMSLWKSMKDVFGRGQSLAQTATVKTSEFMELISTDQTFQIKVAVISSGVLVGAIAAGRGRRPFRRSFYSAGLGTIAFSACYPQKAWVISQKGFEQSKVLFYKLKTMYDEQQQKRLSQTTEEKPKVNEAEVKEFVEEPPEAKPVVQAEPEPAPEVEIIEEIKDISSSTITTALDSDSDRSYLSYIPFLGWFFSGKSSEDSSALQDAPVALTTQADSDAVKSTSLIEKDSKQAIVGDLGQSNPEDKDMYSTRE